MADRFGLSCAILTPFADDGRPDLPLLVRHAASILHDGADSITLFGTTGEGPSIGPTERHAAIGAVLGAGLEPRRQLVVGIIAASLEEAAAQARAGLEANAKALLIAPPFYFKGVADDGVFAWFAALFAAVGPGLRDVILYHIPQVTGVGLSVDLVGRLKAAYPTIVTGVKDSEGVFPHTESLLAAHRDHLAIMIGHEHQLAAAVRLGAQGTICGYANLIPGALRTLVYEGREHTDVARMDRIIAGIPFLAAFKTVLAHRTGHASWANLRPPLAALSREVSAEVLRRYAQEFGG